MLGLRVIVAYDSNTMHTQQECTRFHTCRHTYQCGESRRAWPGKREHVCPSGPMPRITRSIDGGLPATDSSVALYSAVAVAKLALVLTGNTLASVTGSCSSG